jgi:hypothetical protein
VRKEEAREEEAAGRGLISRHPQAVRRSTGRVHLEAVEKSGELIGGVCEVGRGERGRIPGIRQAQRVRIPGRDPDAPILGECRPRLVCILVEGRGGRDPEEAVEVARTAGLPLKAVPVVREAQGGTEDVVRKGLESNHQVGRELHTESIYSL